MALEIENAKKFVEKTYCFMDQETNEYKVRKGKDGLTTSQLRKFLTAVAKISNDVSEECDGILRVELQRKIMMLRVRLAYQAGRTNCEPVKPLYLHLEKEIVTIKEKVQWKVFADYIETIVAYHKFYGGEN